MSTKELTRSTGNQIANLDPSIIASLVIGGDLKSLNDAQKVAFYNYRCQQAGLDPAAKPFDLLTLNGKQILYANATCTQQLTAVHKLSDAITSKEFMSGLFVVSVKVTGPDGRSTENMAAVNVEGLKGEALANAMMKSCTKAKRRTVLAHCGLGLLDETEVETIPNATAEAWQEEKKEQPAQELHAEEVPTIDQWKDEISKCEDLTALGAFYRQNKNVVDSTPEILSLFSERKASLKQAA